MTIEKIVLKPFVNFVSFVVKKCSFNHKEHKEHKE
jgi:hypothetical protein